MTVTTRSPDVALTPRGQGETVLLVEDEPRLREVTAATLVNLGYRVIEAENGTVAMRALAEHAEIEIVFSDLLMPGQLSGLDLAKRVRELYPRLPIILTSAYSAELLDTNRGDHELQVMRKPYRPGEIARAFSRALKGSGPA